MDLTDWKHFSIHLHDKYWPQVLVSAKTPQSITYVFRTFLSKTAVYTFFSSAHETFSRIDHMLGHKTNLYKFKNKTIQSIFFSHHRTVQFQLLQHYWSGHRLGLLCYWMGCLGNRDHSVILEIASMYCISDSFVDYEGYSISSKEFLPK